MVRSLEELSMNAWPSLETIHYDGWVIRLSNGYTKRANSVYPLYPSTIDVTKKIDKCEQLFLSKNLHSVFKLTHYSNPQGLDDILCDKGYTVINPTSVQTLKLDSIPVPSYSNSSISNYADEDWLSNYCALSNFNKHNFHILTQMLRNIIPQKYFVSLKKDDKVIGCGLGVIENEHIGLFDIIIHPAYRGQGFGEQLLLNILNTGKVNGAKTAYLQVTIENTAAMRLYSKLGFKEMYKYWYRIR